MIWAASGGIAASADLLESGHRVSRREMLANRSKIWFYRRRLELIWAVFASIFVVGLLAVMTSSAAAEEPSDNSAQILHLQEQLAALEAEYAQSATELEQWANIEITVVRDRWEQAIQDLKAEVESEIQRLFRKYEYESRQILLETRRDGSLRILKAELDAAIEEKWAWFESQARMKRRYLQNDIAEIERTKAFELNYLLALIDEVESELQTLLLEADLPIEEPQDVFPTVDHVPEDRQESPVAVSASESTTDQAPLDSGSGESRWKRGFFMNSISADPNGFNWALEPTALAVIGILITLAATGVQLLRGN